MRILRMIIECATPLHCGSGEADAVQDQPIVRDAFGLWRIPGTSLAGALRAIGEKLNANLAEGMFGNGNDNKKTPSLIWCEDALLLDFDGRPALLKKLAGEDVKIEEEVNKIFMRDHVRLDLEKGSAVQGGKFDAEIVPAGARFLLEIRCDGWDEREKPLTDEQKKFFDNLASLLEAGELALGGKNANGYGQYKTLECQYVELDLKSPKDMEIWINSGPGILPKEGQGKVLELPHCAAAVSGANGLCGSIEMSLVCEGPILIGGGKPERPDGSIAEADMLFALSPRLDYGAQKIVWNYDLPGTSIKGVLRHAVYGILKDLGLDEKNAEVRLNRLFGFVEGDKGQCGKVWVEDCHLRKFDKPGQYVQHVAIDRFTGGALDGALFGEEPLWISGLQAPLRMKVENADASDAALIFHALLNLAEGSLCVGCGVNRGNGRLCLKDWPNNPTKALASIKGTLAFEGQPLLVGEETCAALQKNAAEWQNALDKETRQ